MQHPYIEEHNFVERYLTKRLNPEERAAFEEHFIDCPDCLDAIEFAQSLSDGIKLVAAEPAAPPKRSLWATFREAAFWRGAALAAACVLVLLLPVAVLVERRIDDVQSRYAGELQANAAIRRQLERGPSVFLLTETRGVGSAVANVPLPASPALLVFSIERDMTAYRAYRVTLLDAGGQTVWQNDRIEPNSPDALGLSFLSSLLRPGEYTIRLDGISAQNQLITMGNFKFHAMR